MYIDECGTIDTSSIVHMLFVGDESLSCVQWRRRRDGLCWSERGCTTPFVRVSLPEEGSASVVR